MTAQIEFTTVIALRKFHQIEIGPSNLFICPLTGDTTKAVCENYPYVGLTVGPSILRPGGRSVRLITGKRPSFNVNFANIKQF